MRRRAIITGLVTLLVGGMVGVSACGSSALEGESPAAKTERGVTKSFATFMRAVRAHDVATSCRLSFPRGEQLLTETSLHRIRDLLSVQRKWIAACIQARFFVAPGRPNSLRSLAIHGLVVHGHLATGHVAGRVATVQTPGKPVQPTQFVRVGEQWLTTIPIPKPS